MSRAPPGLPRHDAPLSLDVCEQAMRWWLTLQDTDADAQTHADLAQWRSASRHHEIAWQRAQALAGKMGAFRQAGDAALAKEVLLAPGGPALDRRQTIKGLAVLLLAGGAAWGARETSLVQQLSADYKTGVGERRTLKLSSQLELSLNTRSALDAHWVDQRWQLDLRAGEVLIDTSASPPLWLRTDRVNVSAATARFVARRLDDGDTRVSVLSGALQVTDLRRLASVTLMAGEQARFSPGAAPMRSPLSPAFAAWSQGMIVAEGQPLRDFLDEVARYRHGHLGCDQSLAALPVWGTFPLDDSDRIVEAVAETLQLDVQRFTRLWVNLRRSKNNV